MFFLFHLIFYHLVADFNSKKKKITFCIKIRLCQFKMIFDIYNTPIMFQYLNLFGFCFSRFLKIKNLKSKWIAKKSNRIENFRFLKKLRFPKF